MFRIVQISYLTFRKRHDDCYSRSIARYLTRTRIICINRREKEIENHSARLLQFCRGSNIVRRMDGSYVDISKLDLLFDSEPDARDVEA